MTNENNVLRGRDYGSSVAGGCALWRPRILAKSEYLLDSHGHEGYKPIRRQRWVSAEGIHCHVNCAVLYIGSADVGLPRTKLYCKRTS